MLQGRQRSFMHDEPGPFTNIAGARIVLIGRFARTTRRELSQRLLAAGATVDREVTPGATHVIVGGAGWPLKKSGQLPRGLLVAGILHARQSMPLVVEEDTFYERAPLPAVSSHNGTMTDVV